MTFYQENPHKDVEKTFCYEGITKTVLASTILAKCGSNAYKIIKCSKERYGYKVVYSLKKGKFDSRDSNQVNAFISFTSLI